MRRTLYRCGYLQGFHPTCPVSSWASSPPSRTTRREVFGQDYAPERPPDSWGQRTLRPGPCPIVPSVFSHDRPSVLRTQGRGRDGERTILGNSFSQGDGLGVRGVEVYLYGRVSHGLRKGPNVCPTVRCFGVPLPRRVKRHEALSHDEAPWNLSTDPRRPPNPTPNIKHEGLQTGAPTSDGQTTGNLPSTVILPNPPAPTTLRDFDSGLRVRTLPGRASRKTGTELKDRTP